MSPKKIPQTLHTLYCNYGFILNNDIFLKVELNFSIHQACDFCDKKSVTHILLCGFQNLNLTENNNQHAFYFVSFQGSLLALFSVLIPGRAQLTIWEAGSNSGLLHAVILPRRFLFLPSYRNWREVGNTFKQQLKKSSHSENSCILDSPEKQKTGSERRAGQGRL